MTGSVDIHAHVLPAIDDGPETAEESLGLLRMMAEAGTSVCVATPHYSPPAWTLEGAAAALDSLAVAAAREGIPVGLHLGAENAIYAEIQADSEAGLLRTLAGGRAVLLEMPMGSLPPRFREFVFSLSTRGYRPVLAHPERSPAFSWDVRHVGPLRESGALVQITAGSLFGENGRQEKAFARELVKAGFVDVIASDAHGDPPRLLNLPEAAAEAGRWCGEEAALAMITSTPLGLLR